MEDEKKILNELEEEPENEVVEAPPTEPPRNKTPSRIYFGIVTFGMLIFLLLCVIALGSFGAKQAQLPGFYQEERELGFIRGGICLLFVNTDPDVGYTFGSYGPCVFIFWGLTSGTLLAFVLVIYSIVMLVVGFRILNLLRLVDFILCFAGFLGFFAFSITLTAGLNKTCAGITAAGASCSLSSFLNLGGSNLYFYSSIAAAMNCCWIITIALFMFSMWNLILVIFFFRQRAKKRRMASITEIEINTSSLTSPVEQPPPYSYTVKE